jgi:hypothetical protein
MPFSLRREVLGSKIQYRRHPGRDNHLNIASDRRHCLIGWSPIIGAIRRDTGNLLFDHGEQRFTCEESPLSFSVNVAATIIPVTASVARCSFRQVRLAFAPCFSRDHSPAP